MSAPKYVNRELSWLEFNQRVLDEAREEGQPLLERLKFLAITASNLDEFFMIRVGSLRTLRDEAGERTDIAGLTPQEQLDLISARTQRMAADQHTCYLEQLEPALAHEGVRRMHSEGLSERQRRFAERFFETEIQPILTPMPVNRDEEFPLLAARTLNLCVHLAPETDGESTDEPAGQPRFAVIPCGRGVPRFVTLPSDGGYEYILIEELIGMFLGEYFPGEEIRGWSAFRISRNANMAVREDLAFDLLALMEEILDARKESACVRLEIADRADAQTLAFLCDAMNVDREFVYRLAGPLDLAAFFQIASVPGFPHLRDEPWPPQPSTEVDPRAKMFDILAERPILLAHPFESFEPVIRFIEEAAEDPDVLAIKQVLYRTARDSRVVAALMKAAERGKHVTVVVELKARFDEARNIEWARDLERAGAQVIYGVKGFKIHAKVCVVVRRDPDGIRRYVHYGTGNYNESTARLYTDVSYLTCDDDLGADASAFFNAINGYSQMQPFQKIAAAPIGLRDRLLEMIHAECQFQREGREGHIMAKFNALADPALIDAFYEASQAGVRVDLNIRGICCLRPGVKGMSENISVISVIDRFLEHSRIFYFAHGGDERVFISSADGMPRNLDRRLELIIPIDDSESRRRLVTILRVCMQDAVKGRLILSDGTYARPLPAAEIKGEETTRSQQVLYARACEAVKQAKEQQRLVFEPYRAEENAG